MRELNLKHLHYFWVVAQEGSIVGASERLFVTPQTISAQLKQLEARLQRPLFRKKGTGIALTREGEIARDYADAIFDLSKELTVTLAAKDQGGGQVRVGLVDGVPKLIATMVLHPLTEMSPPVRLMCQEDDLGSLVALLAQHKLDFIVSDHPAPPDENLRLYSHELGSTGISLMASPGLVGTESAAFPDCLRRLPVLLPGRKTAIRMALDSWLRNNDIDMRVAGEFDDSALIKAFGQTGAGVFACPTVIETEVARQYAVTTVGRIDDIRERFYVISGTRHLEQSPLGQLLERVKSEVFDTSV